MDSIDGVVVSKILKLELAYVSARDLGSKLSDPLSHPIEAGSCRLAEWFGGLAGPAGVAGAAGLAGVGWPGRAY